MFGESLLFCKIISKQSVWENKPWAIIIIIDDDNDDDKNGDDDDKTNTSDVAF